MILGYGYSVHILWFRWIMFLEGWF